MVTAAIVTKGGIFATAFPSAYTTLPVLAGSDAIPRPCVALGLQRVPSIDLLAAVFDELADFDANAAHEVVAELLMGEH